MTTLSDVMHSLGTFHSIADRDSFKIDRAFFTLADGGNSRTRTLECDVRSKTFPHIILQQAN